MKLRGLADQIVTVVVFMFFIGALALSCGDSEPTGTDSGAGDGDTDGDTDGDSDGDTDGDSDGDSDGDGGSGDAGEEATGVLTGTIRDFHSSHPDFEGQTGAESGIVAAVLGDDGKPVYAGGDGTVTTNGEENFNQWYNDVADINLADSLTLVLEDDGTGTFVYDNQEFFPIDDQLFENEENIHNYHFTFELHTEFTYLGEEIFGFTGDDDLWVFINGHLAMDLGGVHGPASDEVDLDALSETLEIVEGNTYSLDFFFAERHTTQSTFRIETTITDLTTPIE